jgi:hypothetical protein
VQGPLHPSLERTAPDAFAQRVQRQGVVNAWDDPNFSKAVAETGRKQLIIAAVTSGQGGLTALFVDYTPSPVLRFSGSTGDAAATIYTVSVGVQLQR